MDQEHPQAPPVPEQATPPQACEPMVLVLSPWHRKPKPKCMFAAICKTPCRGLVRPVEKQLLKLHFIAVPLTPGTHAPICDTHRRFLGISMKA